MGTAMTVWLLDFRVTFVPPAGARVFVLTASWADCPAASMVASIIRVRGGEPEDQWIWQKTWTPIKDAKNSVHVFCILQKRMHAAF